MRVSYCPDYYVPLPEGHPFPMQKFPALYQILMRERLISAEDVSEPRPAAWEDLLLPIHPPTWTACGGGRWTGRRSGGLACHGRSGW